MNNSNLGERRARRNKMAIIFEFVAIRVIPARDIPLS